MLSLYLIKKLFIERNFNLSRNEVTRACENFGAIVNTGDVEVVAAVLDAPAIRYLKDAILQLDQLCREDRRLDKSTTKILLEQALEGIQSLHIQDVDRSAKKYRILIELGRELDSQFKKARVASPDFAKNIHKIFDEEVRMILEPQNRRVIFDLRDSSAVREYGDFLVHAAAGSKRPAQWYIVNYLMATGMRCYELDFSMEIGSNLVDLKKTLEYAGTELGAQFDAWGKEFAGGTRWGSGFIFDDKAATEVVPEPHAGANPDLFRQLYPIMRLVVLMEEVGHAELYTNLIAKIFDDFNEASSFISRWAGGDTNSPIHDLLVAVETPPVNEAWDKVTWQKLMDRHGVEIARLLGLAGKIEREIAQKNAAQSPESGKRSLQLAALTLSEIRELAGQVVYGRAKEFPELATVCIRFHVAEEKFEESIKILQDAKKRDSMPELHLDGASLGFPQFVMRKLKPTNPLNLWIGKDVKCCNYLGGETAQMAVAHVTSPNCACYVIFRKRGGDEVPVAKVSGYRDLGENIVFNSWERADVQYDAIHKPFLLAAGLAMLKSDKAAARVTIGRRASRYESFEPFPAITDPLGPKELPENVFYDSKRQHLVVSREVLAEAEKELERLVKEQIKNQAEEMERRKGKSANHPSTTAQDLRPTPGRHQSPESQPSHRS